MAEILLSLTIIGVVAAITLPSLTGNINERTWNTQRKALYARFSQAISLMPALNGYGTLTEATDSASAVDNAAETFITAGLSKVLKINNICDNTHLADCGIVSSFNDMGGSQVTTPTTLHRLSDHFRRIVVGSVSYSTVNTNAAAFETQNGESIIAYYNRSCTAEYLSNGSITVSGNTTGFPHKTMCVNFIYDLNGNKGPNTVGKDIGFITVFNATDSIIVAPLPTSANNAKFENNEQISWYNASKACTQQGSESRLPNIDEASAMLINKSLINFPNQSLWTSTPLATNPTQAWQVNYVGWRLTEYKVNSRNVRCIKR
ncbi:MAG: hypothetical protein NC390_00065 [Fusobacterium sp.]|nr:hypothetical protein [Fusobacterium sp.]